MEKELMKWTKHKEKQKNKHYFLIFLIVVTVIYAIDEVTSSINGTIKTDVIKYFYDIVGSDVNSPKFNDASGNYFLLSMLLYVCILFAPFYKSLADKFGRKVFLSINTCLMSIGMFICMLSQTLFGYLFGSMIMIFSIPNDFHVMYIMETAPAKHRNKIASITKAIGLMSVSLIGVLRLIFMKDASDAQAWRGIYIVPVILSLIVGVISFFIMYETPAFINKKIQLLESEEENQRLSEQKQNLQTGVIYAIKYIFKNKQLKWIFIAGLLYAIGNGATNYYESVFQIMGSQEAISVAIICFPITNSIITSISGFISDKFGRKKTVLTLGVTSVFMMILYVLFAHLNLGGIVVGITYGIFIGCLYSASDIIFLVMSSESTPTHIRSSVVGTMSFMLFVGTAVSWGLIIVSQMLLQDWGLASLTTIPFLIASVIVVMKCVEETNGKNLDEITECEV